MGVKLSQRGTSLGDFGFGIGCGGTLISGLEAFRRPRPLGCACAHQELELGCIYVNRYVSPCITKLERMKQQCMRTASTNERELKVTLQEICTQKNDDRLPACNNSRQPQAQNDTDWQEDREREIDRWKVTTI